MTKVIIIPEEDLDRFYKRTMNYLHAKYHNQPTTLRRRPSDNAQSAYDAQGRHEAAEWDGLMGREQHGKGKRR